MRESPHFALFAYGTLKAGFQHFSRHCAHAHSIETAYVWGRLYDLDAGYPALEVPPDAIQARGSCAYVQDAATVGLLSDFEKPEGDWDLVQGELMLFADPQLTIPPLDELEDFNACRQVNLYERVLLTVRTEQGLRHAWTYVIQHDKHGGRRLSLNESGVVQWFAQKPIHQLSAESAALAQAYESDFPDQSVLPA